MCKKNRHLTLCVVLITNAICMEVIPIILTELYNDTVSIILSISLLLLVGELFPQALYCKNPLVIAYYMRWLIWTMTIITYIIAKPLSMLLTYIFGEDAQFLQKREIAAFCL